MYVVKAMKKGMCESSCSAPAAAAGEVAAAAAAAGDAFLLADFGIVRSGGGGSGGGQSSGGGEAAAPGSGPLPRPSASEAVRGSEEGNPDTARRARSARHERNDAAGRAV